MRHGFMAHTTNPATAKTQIQRYSARLGVLMLLALISKFCLAHLMVAQHGTLNFLDNNVYMVLSLPASAFVGADEDNDGKLSITEFTQHRSTIINVVKQRVRLGSKGKNFALQDLMVSPVTPHNAPADPATQIIAMGRYPVENNVDGLYFSVELFGKTADSKYLKITASRNSTNDKHVFELAPAHNNVKLNFN